jgi:hypothetical protein
MTSIMLGDLTLDSLTPRTRLGCLASLHKQPTTHLFRVFIIFKMSFTHDDIWILEGEQDCPDLTCPARSGPGAWEQRLQILRDKRPLAHYGTFFPLVFGMG